MEKECIIHNGRLTFELIVDDNKIEFHGSYNADYFEEHYNNLGYKVI